MDKLEPVLKQKFWILLGIGLIMTVTGWWMATGSLKAAITTREGEIKAAEGKVPSGQIPNSDWTKQLAEINTLQDGSINSTKLALWERQKQHMFWPQGMEEYAWKKGYRGEIELPVRENYRLGYVVDVDRVYAAANPFNWLDGTGIVEFKKEKLPRLVDIGSAPTSDRMWDFQEDLWLLESLLQSISDFNGGPNAGRQDASVHVIDTLSLHGGQPANQRKVSAAGASGSGSSSGMPMSPPGETPGAFGSSGGGGGAATAVSAEFDRREEFGDDGMGSGAGGGPDMLTSSGPSGVPTGAASTPKGRRYVEDDKNLPYKTRGFYLSVIMDHRKVPGLIAALSSNEKSAWPVEIVRVQVVRLMDDDLTGASGGGGMNYPTGGTPFGSSSTSTGTPFGSNESFSSAPTGFTEALSGDPTSSGPFNATSGSGFTLPTGGGNSSNPQAQAAIQQFQAAMQDPFMAKVALAGFITLYNPVAPPVAPVNPSQPASPPGTATPAVTAPAGTPQGSGAAVTPEAKSAEPAAGENKPAETPTTDAAPTDNSAAPKPDPAGTTPEASKDAKPEEKTEQPKDEAAVEKK